MNGVQISINLTYPLISGYLSRSLFFLIHHDRATLHPLISALAMAHSAIAAPHSEPWLSTCRQDDRSRQVQGWEGWRNDRIPARKSLELIRTIG